MADWQKESMRKYSNGKFLGLLDTYNMKLSGVWDSDFTINGEVLLDIINQGYGAAYSLQQAADRLVQLEKNQCTEPDCVVVRTWQKTRQQRAALQKENKQQAEQIAELQGRKTTCPACKCEFAEGILKVAELKAELKAE